MKSFFFMPPLENISGGMLVIAQLASHLAASGYAVSYVTNGKFPASLMNPLIPVQQIKDIDINPEDRWIVPEGWPIALAPGLAKKAKCAVYVQNWAFLHGCLPEGTDWRDLPVRMLAVSKPVEIFIKSTTGLDARIARPAIDPDQFNPLGRAPSSPRKRIKIAWMPRKNKGLAKQIQIIFQEMAKTEGLPVPEWLAIERRSQADVAKILRSCDIFLSTGFPEGFGFPPLEAMACGTLAAGFAGMGGWEYMRQALPNGYVPAFDLPAAPWGANGFYAADGDSWACALALKGACQALLANGAELEAIRSAGLATANWYSPARQREEIINIWQDNSFWNDSH